MKKIFSLLAFLLSAALLGGCATSRSVLDIPSPVDKSRAESAADKEVLVVAVNDKRIFQENPSSPEIASLSPYEDQSEKTRSRAVGRKRNSFGKALGDILLKEEQSVETLTAESIQQAFAEKGYRVLKDKTQATTKTWRVNADVEKFWSWMNPGFAAITLSTEISTTIDIQSPEEKSTQTVSVKASDYFQTGMEGNWVEVINKALRLYIDQLKTKLK